MGPVSAARRGRSLDTAEAPVRIRLLRRIDGATHDRRPGTTTRHPRCRAGGRLAARQRRPPATARRFGPAPGPAGRHRGDRPHAAGSSTSSTRRSSRAVFPRSNERPRACSARRRAPTGSSCSKRWSSRTERVGLRRLAVSPFVGWDAAGLEHNDVDRLALRLRFWLRVFQERGVAALFETISRDERLPARLLGQLDGERRMTDLRHVAEALHAETMAAGLGLDGRPRVVATSRGRRQPGLLGRAQPASRFRLRSRTGRHRAREQGTGVPDRARPVRLGSVGLRPRHPAVPRRRGGPTRPQRRRTDAPGFAEDQRRHKSEEFGEDLRLLYVALTRAQSQVTAWWAPSTKNTPCAPLHRLLFTDAPAVQVPERVPVPNDAAALTRASTLVVDGCLSVSVVPDGDDVSWQPAPSISGDAGRGGAESRARHRLAADVLQRADRRHAHRPADDR